MKIAVVLFNLGGPDKLESVRPFLFNLFRDRAILRLPFFVRYPLARLISTTRAKEASHIYAALGGRSPLLPNTEDQAVALTKTLNQNTTDEYRCFIAMRYWHPLSEETAARLKAFRPDRIVFLPLYPQFSTTTTASSIDAFEKALAREKVRTRISSICCYPEESGFIKALASRTRDAYHDLLSECHANNITTPPRVLFSAHGLPQKIVDAGDPYATQCERTAAALVKELNIANLDWRLCYQSRVGPLKWITPYTDVEIENAAREKRPILVVPIAFVSEHSETLYEIDQLFSALALKNGAPAFARALTVGTHPLFIEGLAGMVREVLSYKAKDDAPFIGYGSTQGSQAA
jgi:ferrochelatase